MNSIQKVKGGFLLIILKSINSIICNHKQNVLELSKRENPPKAFICIGKYISLGKVTQFYPPFCPLLTSRWWISIASLGVVITSIPSVNSHDLLVVSLIRFVDAGEVGTGSPDLGDGDGRDGHEQHDS